ncbi:hypothetical protein [Glutamicibacter ardleyensis]|uniref:hypothetical protein n=1 Tax=Glutamicibacter ardleyensis TaxID=225894 RepID=UPI003FD4DAEF
MNELTIKERVEVYEATQRLASSDEQTPIRKSILRRMHQPTHVQKIVFERRNALQVLNVANGECSTFEAQELVDYFTVPFAQKPEGWPEDTAWVPEKYTAEDHMLTCGALIFADRRTLNLVHRLAKGHGFGSEPGFSCNPRRQMDFISRMRGSILFPVLTEVLDSSYWLPLGFDSASLDDWMEAFNVPTVQVERSLASLLSHAIAGQTCHDDLYLKSIDDAFRNEMSIFVTSSRPSTRSDHALFQRIEKFVSHTEFMACFEPALLELHSITGVTSSLTEYQQEDKTVEGLISSPFTSKVGKKVIITDGKSFYRSEVAELKFVDHQLVAGFLVRGARRATTLQDLLDSHPHRLWVFEEPFSLPSGEPGTRWASNPESD